MRAVWVVALGVVAAVMAGGAPARADFAITPPSLELEVGRGDRRDAEVTMRFERERGTRFAVAVRDVVADRGSGESFRAPGDRRNSPARWIFPSDRRFVAGADGERTLRVRIRVPRDALPGDAVAAIVLTRMAPGGGVRPSVEELAVRTVVRVPGRAVERARIGPIEMPRVRDGGPLTARMTVENTGTALLDFVGRHPGRLRVGAAVAPLTGRLFPGGRRELRVTLRDTDVIGRVRAQADVRVGGRRITREASTWIVPWREPVAALMLAGAFLLVRRRFARRTSG